jgi:hypothetical protein
MFSDTLYIIHLFNSIHSTVMLNCRLHTCPSKCHQLYDHSKMPCQHTRETQCPKGHVQTWLCQESPPSVCLKCERATKLAEAKKTKAAALQRKREAEELAHAQRLADIDEKIAAEIQANRDRQLVEERKRAIEQKEKDLENVKSRPSQAIATPPIIAAGVPDVQSSASSPPSSRNTQPASSPAQDSTRKPQKAVKPPNVVPTEPQVSKSQQEWETKKKVDGASNDAIDSIMDLIGLEEVKHQVISIYEKIEVKKRQGTSMNNERFNIVLLGNPGTGWPLLLSSIAGKDSSTDDLLCR